MVRNERRQTNQSEGNSILEKLIENNARNIEACFFLMFDRLNFKVSALFSLFVYSFLFLGFLQYPSFSFFVAQYSLVLKKVPKLSYLKIHDFVFNAFSLRNVLLFVSMLLRMCWNAWNHEHKQLWIIFNLLLIRKIANNKILK